jgi:hypothetical protein
MKEINWTAREKNEEIMQRPENERRIIHAHTIKRRKANWIGYIFSRHWLLKHIT